MDIEYVYKTIKVLLEQRVGKEPSGVPFNELATAVIEDLKMSLNELVEEKRLSYKININKQPIFYDNVQG